MNARNVEKRYYYIALVILLSINPLTYYFNATISHPQPDSATYMALADRIIDDGVMYLHGWGHVDSGLILPPMYPFLIAVSKNFADIVVASHRVSCLSLLLAIIPLFFYIRSLTNLPVAFVTILAIQLNYLYLYYGTAILSEATFIFFLILGLTLLQHLVKKPSFTTAFVLGGVACCLFLTRHIGLFFILTLIPFLLILQWKKPNKYTKSIIFTSIIGFLIIFLPFSTALYQQTQETPFVQYYRMGLYKVSADDVETSPQKNYDNYSEVFNQRREDRKLLPDSSEMYGKLFNKKHTKSIFEYLNINQIFNNLTKNFKSINEMLGFPLTLLFIFSIISTLVLRVNSRQDLLRIIIPLFIFSYISFVSIITGLVSRYIDVIFPFIFIHIVSELYYLTKRIPVVDSRKYQILGLAILAVSLGYLTPSWLFSNAHIPLQKLNNDPLYGCKEFITNNAPIFSIHPGIAFTLGGTYRVLPNDSFDKVAQYAQFTSVKWMILASSPADIGEADLYTHSDWIQQGIGFEKLYPDLVKLRCLVQTASGEKISALYEFSD